MCIENIFFQQLNFECQTLQKLQEGPFYTLGKGFEKLQQMIEYCQMWIDGRLDKILQQRSLTSEKNTINLYKLRLLLGLLFFFSPFNSVLLYQIFLFNISKQKARDRALTTYRQRNKNDFNRRDKTIELQFPLLLLQAC